LRRQASMPSLHGSDSEDDVPVVSAKEYIATIDQLSLLHAQAIAEVQESVQTLNSRLENLSDDLTKTRETLAVEQDRRQAETAQRTKRETARKKRATDNAIAREDEINHLREELHSSEVDNQALKKFAADAQSVVNDMQEDIGMLEYQLDSTRFQREQALKAITKTSSANKALIARAKRAEKDLQDNEHKTALKMKELGDDTVRAREKAGLALIQRNLAHAKLQQQASDRLTSGASSVARDQTLMDALVSRAPSTSKIDAPGAGRKAARAMYKGTEKAKTLIRQAKGEATPEAKISVLEANNLALTATNEELSRQLQRLRELNAVILADVQKYKLALRNLCAKVGISIDEIISSPSG